MLGISNFLYTNKGIYSVEEFLNLDIKPKVLSFKDDPNDKDFLTYLFQDIDEVEIIKNQEIFEMKFLDVYSNRTIILNGGLETQILQYNIINTAKDPVITKNFQIIKYLTSNINHPKIFFLWKYIKDLLNYSNKSPNICLGDTIVKYSNKILLEKGNLYKFKHKEEIIPVFSLMTKATHNNFLLIK